MRRLLQKLLVLALWVGSMNVFAQSNVDVNKVYQVKDLLDEKVLNVEIKEHFVREIRKTGLVKEIDNHDFEHFVLDRYEQIYKPTIKKELSKYKEISFGMGFSLTINIIAEMAKDFNEFKEKNPNYSAHNYNITTQDVEIFKLTPPINPEETYGPGQPCNNADFETGNCNGWDVITGTVPSAPSTPYSFTQSGTSACGTSPNHVIMTGGNDAQGGFPRVYPGGGATSVMLGDGTGTGNGAARIRQTFLVDANSAAFSYHYAVVLNDAGHSNVEQPYFSVRMFDQGGNSITCGAYEVVAPPCAGTGTGCDPDFVAYAGGFYSDWRSAFAPLQGYIGQNVTIEFTTGDCSQSGHYGYAYVDANCDPLQIIPSETVICGGQPVTLTAPAGASSYVWSPGGQTTQSITTNVPGHYEVTLTPVTGAACGLTLTADIGGSPDYPVAQFTANPTNVCAGTPINFTNTSYVVGASAIDSVQWDFNSDGIVDNTTTSPTYTYSTAGNYTATLTVYNNGCTDDTTVNITITPGTVAAFTTTPVCEGVATTFTNTSSGGANTYGWDFDNNGTTDNATPNPTFTFATPGTYPVTLNVSNSGSCGHDTTINVVVHPNPIANFTATDECLTTATTFTDASNVSTGSITGWAWDFDNNTTTDNTTQNPTHTYGTVGIQTINLTVTTDNSCTDSFSTTVEVFANPVANFSTDAPCEGNATTFTDLSSDGSVAISIWNWDFDNNTTTDNTTQNPTFNLGTANTYPVTLYVEDVNGCNHSVTQNVIVNPNPTAGFTFTNVCFGTTTGFTNQSNGNGGTINQFAWDFTNNGTVDNTNQNPTNGYSSAGTYTVELHVTTTDGCVDSITRVVTVNPIPVSDFSSTTECLGTTTTFTDESTVSTGAVTNWSWDFNDGSPADNNQSPTHVYASAGIYNVTLTVTSDSGCINNFSTNVEVYSNPVATFTTDVACLTYATTFTDSSTPGDNPITIWNWDFDNNSTVDITDQNPTSILPTAGTHNVNLYVEDSHGCNHDTTIIVTVSENPIANFTHTIECFGTSTTFTDASNNNGGTTNIDTWEWDFDGNGTIDNTSQSPTFNFPSAGTYQTELYVTSTLGCMDSITIAVVVNPIPVSDFSSTTECLGTTTTFTDESTVSTGAVTNWSWDFNDGSPADNNQSPTHVYASAGIYNVTLTVTSDSGCINNFSTNVEVYSNPVATFTTDVACLTYATTFTDSSTPGDNPITIWNWDFDNNSTVDITDQNPTSILPTAGTHNVNLYVEDSHGCNHDTTITVTVSENPIANFTHTIECFGTSTTFTDASNNNGGTTNIDTWEWDFDGNGTIDNTSQSPTFNFPSAGTYQTELYVTSTLGCMDSITIAVVVDPIPVANFTATSECLEFTTTFTNNSTVATGTITQNDWDFADGTGTSTLLNPTYTYASSGTFNVELTVTSDSGCVHSVIVPVTVNPKPSADFNVADVCLNVAAPITDASVGNGGTVNQWEWDFTNNGSIDNTTQNPSNFYVTDGTFDIRLVATTADGCKDTIIKPVTIYPMPIADFTYVNACYGTGVDFTNTSNVTSGTITNWDWSFGNGQTSVVENPTENYASEGLYNVQLIVTTNNNCRDTIIRNGIEVWPLPAVDFIPTTVCLNNVTQFEDQSTVSNTYTTNTIVNWTWNFADGTAFSNDQNPTHTYTTEGVYQAVLVVTTNNNCVDSITKDVTVHPLPIVDFSADNFEGCTPVCATFTDGSTISSGNITQWAWDFNGDGISDNVNQNPANCFLNPSHSSVRDFDITLTATSQFGCSTTLTKSDYIHSYPIPLASFTYWPNDEASIVDNDIAFTDQSIIGSVWNWDLGDGTTTTVQNPAHEYQDTGFYLVTLAIENVYGCRDTTQKYVNIKPIYAIWIPNAFTPDGDFKNDFFYVDGYGIKELKVMIFDRWGLKLYDEIGVDQSWDGTYKGNLVPTDVYVYKIRAKDIFDEWHDYIGKVSVIK
jgi:gliding motility-associated-like protein